MHDIIIDIIVLPWRDDTHIRYLKLLSNKQPHHGANLTWISHDTLWVKAVFMNFEVMWKCTKENVNKNITLD